MFTLLVVFVVLYQNQVGRRTRRKKQTKNLGFQLSCEKFENKTQNKKKIEEEEKQASHCIMRLHIIITSSKL